MKNTTFPTEIDANQAFAALQLRVLCIQTTFLIDLT
jgi:hypothetical protein